MRACRMWLMWAVCFFRFFPAGYAYLAAGFDAERLLESSQVVCHVKVEETGPHRAGDGDLGDGEKEDERGAAKVRVLNVIKGDVADTVHVVFRKSTSFVLYTELKKEEESILFLRPMKKPGYYEFVDDHNGRLEVPAHEPLRYKSRSPDDRLVEELVFATKADTGRIRLLCMEELGRFAKKEAMGRLKELSRSDDMAVQGIAYAALIRLDEPPSADDLVKFFARNDDTKSSERFRTTGYSNGHLKGDILNEMALRFNVICRDFNLQSTAEPYVERREAARAAAEKWKEFDLIRFLELARWQDRDTGSVRGNEVIADIIGWQIDEDGAPALISRSSRKGSMRILTGLLASEDRSIRFEAATAISRIEGRFHVGPFPQRNNQEEIDAYVDACKARLRGREGGGEE